MRSAVNVQQMARARVPDNRSAVASIRDIGNSINQGLANYTSAKIRDELMDEAAVSVQQPKTPEQRQADIQTSQIDLAEEQQVAQTQQQAQAKREEITRQATWRDITANPELAKKFMDLQSINPQMAKGVANTLLTRDQVQIEALQKEAVQWNAFTQNVVQMASDPNISDEQLQSTIKSYAAKQSARGAPIDELANLIGLNRDEMYGWGVKQMTDSNNVYQMVEQSKPFVIGKNDRVLDPRTNEVLVDAVEDGVTPNQAIANDLNERKFKVAQQTANLLARRESAKSKTDIAKADKMIVAKEKKARTDATRVVSVIDDAIELTGFFSTGVAGYGLSFNPSTDAAELRRKVETIKANLGLDQLIAIKEQGGTLGALNKTEFDALTNKIANLDAASGVDELRKNLGIVRESYSAVLESIDSPVVDQATQAEADDDGLFSKYGGNE